MADHLTKVFDQSHWPKIRLGLYNGGWIGKLGELPPQTARLSEFLIHAKRIITNLQSYGVPIAVIKATPPSQISIRFEAGVNTESMWFVIVTLSSKPDWRLVRLREASTPSTCFHEE